MDTEKKTVQEEPKTVEEEEEKEEPKTVENDEDILNRLREKIAEEDKKQKEEEEQEKYKSPKATPVDLMIFPVFKYEYDIISKIANSDLTSQFDQNNHKERLFGTQYSIYTDISNPPPSENPYYNSITIDDGDIVYIKNFLEASTELSDICDYSKSCKNPNGFGKVKKYDYGNMALVHFGIFDDKNCIFLVPKHFLKYHTRPSIITNEWLLSNDPDEFTLKKQQNSPSLIHGTSLFDEKASDKPRIPFYTIDQTKLNKDPTKEDAFKFPSNLKGKKKEKGGFSKTSKNNKNINNKTLKAGKNKAASIALNSQIPAVMPVTKTAVFLFSLIVEWADNIVLCFKAISSISTASKYSSLVAS